MTGSRFPRSILITATIALSLAALTTIAPAADWGYVGLAGISTTCLRNDPVHERIFVGTISGLYILELGSGTWIDLDEEGWIGRQVHSIDWHPDLPLRIIAGRENAFFKGYIDYTDDLGENWTIAYNADGGGVMDITHDETFYYACTWPDISPGEFLRSADGGQSWTLITGTGHYAMTSLALSPEGTLYLGGDAPLTRSFDQGLTWEAAAGDLPPGYGIYCLDIPPPQEAMPEVDLFASIDLGLYHTFNCVTWTQVLADACRNIASYPEVGGPIAVVTFGGRVLVSRDGGFAWNDETGNLPGTPVDVAFTTHHRALYVNTAQSGVYRVENIVTGVDSPPSHSAGVELRAWPNPFNPATRLRFNLPQPGPVQLAVFDLAGRQVAALIDGWQAAGPHELTWQPAGLASGHYLARLSSRAGCRLVQLTLLK